MMLPSNDGMVGWMLDGMDGMDVGWDSGWLGWWLDGMVVGMDVG